MNASNDAILAAYWFDRGESDFWHGRASLAAVLTAAGDDLAARSYIDGWMTALGQVAA
jgi:hypothetical protein